MPLAPATLDEQGEGQGSHGGLLCPVALVLRVCLAVAAVFLCPWSESQSVDDNLNISLHLVQREQELCIWREEGLRVKTFL